MKLDNESLHTLFIEKGILYLNHANTVSTSITFFEQNGLLSRGAIENKGLYQSPQSSDVLDKIFNVWNDVFLDTVDLHGYFPRQNLYGPILFKISIDFLLTENLDIWITKNNPIYWTAETPENEKYFVSVEELNDNWNLYQRQKKMVTIKNQLDPILFDYIYQIIVDDPKVKINEIHLFNEARKAIKNVVEHNLKIKNKFTTRICKSCFCTSNYLNDVNKTDLKRLFLPKI
jgi:hypothetical protein